MDAAPSQLGKDLVKVSDSVAQQLSYQILTAPISMFGGSVVFDKAVSKGLSAAEAAKTAGKFSGGVYTGGMALSSAADKYVQCRSEGQGKLEASVRALGTGAISYFTESLGGIGGSKSPLSGLEEKYAESLIGSILYNAFEEGGEEFLEYSADILLDGAVDLAARGEWQQEWDWAEVIENAKIGAMTGGLFGGYQKLGDIKETVDRKIDAKKAAKLEKAVKEYCDYMKSAYRLMNDPNLREIAERRIGDTTIPAATRMNRSETGEMNFGDVLPKRAGEVSFEQMYGTKPPDGTENQSFEEWAERKDAEKKKAAEGADKSSYVNTDTTGKTEEQIRVMEEFKNAVEPEVIEFVKEAENNPSDRWKKKDMGTVSERAANDIKNATGVDVSNFRHSMDVDFVSHVEKRHGKSGIQDHSMANVNDIARIGYVLENYDSISKGKTSEKFKNSDGSHAQTIVYEKAVDGSFYVVEAVPDSKAKKLRLITAYISKKTPSAQVAYAANDLLPTPEASLHTDRVKGDVPSPNANIPQNGNSVNALDAENSVAKAQQNSENAAQTQRAETEEEARLRTLYESEPEGTETAAKTSREAPGTVSFEQMYGTKPPDGTENQSFEEWAERKDAEKKKAAEKEAILAEKQNNADSRSIRTDMTDDERYEALKNEKIKIEPYNSEKLRGENVEQLNTTTSKEVRKYIKTLAEKFEVFKKYISENARIEFRFSRNNLAESASKQGKIKAEYAEMLSATDAIVQNAVLVEAHKDKYAGTTREDKTILQTDVLLSAFADENGIVPVRLTVKEYKDKDNSLYALITLEKIETEVSGRGESLATTPEPYPVSEMSIPDIVSKIKPTDGKILKYLPDKLLSTEQLEGKRAALAKDKGRIEEFSQKGDFAAKAQQAETEEEARLRTLYESEPENGQKEAGAGEGGTDKTDKFIEDTQKRIEDAKITDDKLKEMPEDKQKEVLKDRAERAGLDMDAEELVDFAQSLGRIKGFFGREFKDFARIFDDVSEGNRTIRNDLHKLLEVPHRQAQAQYTESYKNAVKAISDKFAKLGIKAGSKESAAVQRIGEHAYQIDSKGNTAEYTYEMLKRDFPDSWEKIAEAAKFTRNIYDDYLKKLNAMYESIYPQTVEKAEERRSKLNAEAQRMSDYKDSLNEVKKALRENVDKKKAALAKSKDGTQKKADLKRQIATLEARMKAVDSKMAAADSRAFAAKLKEMPEDKQKEVLKDRAERAGLDMDAEELVDFAQSLGRIKGFFGREFKDFARVFDDVSGESIGIRNDLYKFFEVPHRQAQAQYTEGYKNAIKSISEKFGELGIKAGSKESAAVQRIGEHAYQIDSKGNTAEYTYEMLERDFPDSWEKIAEAAKFTRNIYDDYLKNLNEMYERIYPNTLEKAEAYKNKVREKSVREFKKASQLGKYAGGLKPILCAVYFKIKQSRGFFASAFSFCHNCTLIVLSATKYDTKFEKRLKYGGDNRTRTYDPLLVRQVL